MQAASSHRTLAAKIGLGDGFDQRAHRGRRVVFSYRPSRWSDNEWYRHEFMGTVMIEGVECLSEHEASRFSVVDLEDMIGQVHYFASWWLAIAWLGEA